MQPEFGAPAPQDGTESAGQAAVIDLAPVRQPSLIERGPRWLFASALAVSAALHFAAWLLMSTVFRPPELEIEFAVPIDVELGTTEELRAPTENVPAPSEPAPPAATPSAASSALDAGLAAAIDAGPERRARDAGPPQLPTGDAGPRLASSGRDAGVGESRVPPGAQIALRVDMTRIRRSPLADDVRALIAAIPDWRALLDGSGIDPVEQLDRLLIATPNLQRDKIVLAGRYVGGEQVVRDAVERLSAARAEPAHFRTEGPIRIAPWASQDPTPRVIALVGPAHFTISRPEDLPRVLAIASARAQRRGRGRPIAALHPADALLAMEDDEALSLEVEGAAQFVRRARRAIPDRLRLSAIERADAQGTTVRGVFTYPDRERAGEALTYWNELRERYARNALVILLGLSDPLEAAQIEQSEREVRIALELRIEQTRLILGYVRELLKPPVPAP